MTNARNLIIIGPMGAGKTRVGQCLARKLHLPFYDTDQTIEVRSGVDAGFIIDKEGEAGFRKREKEIVAELTKKSNIVLSTGGGTVLDAANRKCLQESGIIIYLRVSVAAQLVRTARNKKRPLLLVADKQKRLNELNVIRIPLYEEIAQLTYDTDQTNIQGLVKQIINDLEAM